MLAGERALVLENQRVHLLHQFGDNFFDFGLAHIHQRDDVEVSVSHVARYGVRHIFCVGFENLLEPREKLRQIFWRNGKVIDKRHGAPVLRMLMEELKALAPHRKVFLHFFLAPCDASVQPKVL